MKKHFIWEWSDKGYRKNVAFEVDVYKSIIKSILPHSPHTIYIFFFSVYSTTAENQRTKMLFYSFGNEFNFSAVKWDSSRTHFIHPLWT